MRVGEALCPDAGAWRSSSCAAFIGHHSCRATPPVSTHDLYVTAPVVPPSAHSTLRRCMHMRRCSPLVLTHPRLPLALVGSLFHHAQLFFPPASSSPAVRHATQSFFRPIAPDRASAELLPVTQVRLPTSELDAVDPTQWKPPIQHAARPAQPAAHPHETANEPPPPADQPSSFSRVQGAPHPTQSSVSPPSLPSHPRPHLPLPPT